MVEIAKAGDTRALDYSGAVKARVEMNLGFRVAGKITERLVNIGDRVKPGDRARPRSIRPTTSLAVKTAEANLAAAEKVWRPPTSPTSAPQQLFDKSVAPKSQMEQASLSHDQAVSTRDAAASVARSGQEPGRPIRSSRLTGMVSSRRSAPMPAAVVAAGTPVVTVALDGEKEVQIAVPENDIAQFKPGKTVKASFWSDNKLVLDGKVREVSGSADPQSRTFSVRVSLPTDDRVLLGMTATIEAAVGNAETNVAIPLECTCRKGRQEDRLGRRSQCVDRPCP